MPGLLLTVKGWRRRPLGHAAFYCSLTLALLLCGSVGGLCYRIRVGNGRESITGLPHHPRPDASSRLLILAPHCDDETLGCGGLIHKAMRANAAVRAVFVTNGDGFHLAARRHSRRIRTRPEDYIRLAIERQQETRAALAHLGVAEKDTLFLGYPDRGIVHLWLSHWREEVAYTSPYTRVSSSPYSNCYRPEAPYCGQALLEDLERIIGEFQPTAVYYPHPNDDHSDHWATSCFARAALERLGLRDRVAAYAYLVHRGDWPVPRGLRPDRGLAPPAALARLDTVWSAFTLDAATLAAKKAALGKYRSQMAMMRRFLSSFVRQTELFGVIPPSRVQRAPAGGMLIDGNASGWDAIAPTVWEPIKDTLPVKVQGGADLAAIRVCRDDKRLYVLVSSRRRLSNRLTYVLHLRTFSGDQRALAIRVRPGRPSSDPDVAVVAQGHSIEASIPLQRLGNADAVFVGAIARTHRFTIDKTGWRVVCLSLKDPARGAGKPSSLLPAPAAETNAHRSLPLA